MADCPMALACMHPRDWVLCGGPSILYLTEQGPTPPPEDLAGPRDQHPPGGRGLRPECQVGVGQTLQGPSVPLCSLLSPRSGWLTCRGGTWPPHPILASSQVRLLGEADGSQ